MEKATNMKRRLLIAALTGAHVGSTAQFTQDSTPTTLTEIAG